MAQKTVDAIKTTNELPIK